MARKSTARKTPAPTKAPIVSVSDDMREAFKDYPDVALLERRLEHPDDPGSVPIYLKDDPRPSCDEVQHFAKARGKGSCPVCAVPFRRWKIRSVNSAMPNRLHGILHHKRYVKVRKDELMDPDLIPDLAAGTDEFVRRGEGGKIVVVKMPFPYYAAIKLRELAQRQERMSNAQKVKSDLADDAGSALGDEAGDSISKMSADFSRPRSTVQDELTGDPK